ncbi:transglutaminase domain-containing protein [uncultured Allobaculum sp.]|uniref:transglutaminase domain-containing protein n=1 Tax=uncultured Allobaculum sp. TaxID=1187017 RepID=UPI00258398E4|nr:transglutaminase domain-containing protein [uncultured Allobaculum sp.]
MRRTGMYDYHGKKGALKSLAVTGIACLLSITVLATPYLFRYYDSTFTSPLASSGTPALPANGGSGGTSGLTAPSNGGNGNGGNGNGGSSASAPTSPSSQNPGYDLLGTVIQDNPTNARPLMKSNEYYYYSLMCAADQEIYNDMLSGLYAFDPDISVVTDDSDHVFNIYMCLLSEHPEIYWVDTGGSYTVMGNQTTFTYRYNRALDAVTAMNRELEQKLQTVRSEIGSPANEYDRLKAAYSYVVEHVEYVAGAPDNQNLISSMMNGESVCAGYTQMMTYLLQDQGIQAFMVTGNVFPNGPHGWNVIRINGNYYQCDSTYGDPVYMSQNGQTVSGAADYDYMITSDEFMLKRRSYDPTEYHAPACTDTQYDPS